MISALEAKQLANAAAKQMDRTADAEKVIDHAIRAHAETGAIETVVVDVPFDLWAAAKKASRLYAANGWQITCDESLRRLRMTTPVYRGTNG